MAICSVFNCDTNNDKKRRKISNQENIVPVKLFRFPKDSTMAKVRINKCCRKDKINPKTAYICSKHFTRDQYFRNLQHELLMYSPKSCKKLKNNAIPTENLPKTKQYLIERSDRLQKRQRQSEVKKLVESQMVEEQLPNPVPIEEEHIEPSTAQENTKDLKETVSRLQQKIIIFQEANISKNSKIIELTQENSRLQQECSATNSIFTPIQKRKLTRSESSVSRVKWTFEEISKCIAIHASGPKAYRFLLQNGYPYPAVITLKKWAAKIDVAPGFLKTVFSLMKNANLSQRDKVCMLMADEMKIRSCYEYDKRADTLLAPANYVQVIMARGIFSNWKQPLYYNYDKKLTKNLINATISNLDSIDYQVVALTMDMGGGNQGLLKQYGVDENHPCIQHPTKQNQKVFIFADVPHMIKLLRNHFLDKGIFFDNKHLTKAPLIELLEIDKNDLKIAPRLTSEHLTVKQSKRQKVKYATQLFSHTNSCALSLVGMSGMLKSSNWRELAELMRTVDAWFDVFNAKAPRIDSRPRKAAYGLQIECQKEILDKMESIVLRMRFGKKAGLLPFQKGILMSIKSLKSLFEYLKESFNVAYILTYRLNQDLLEMFFGIIRAKGGLYDHPSALEFKYRLRSYLLGRNEGIISESANVKAVVEKEIKMDVNLEATTVNTDDESILLTSELLSAVVDCDAEFLNGEHSTTAATTEEEISGIKYEALEYLAGYLLNRFKLKIPSMMDTFTEKNDSTGFTWTDLVNEGGLKKPNESFLKELQKLDSVFNKYNNNKDENALKPCNNYITNLCSLASDCSLDPDIIKTFFRCKMYFRIRIQNQILVDNLWRRKNQLKRKINKTCS